MEPNAVTGSKSALQRCCCPQEGLVSLMLGKKSSEVEAARATILSTMSALLGNPPLCIIVFRIADPCQSNLDLDPSFFVR